MWSHRGNKMQEIKNMINARPEDNFDAQAWLTISNEEPSQENIQEIIDDLLIHKVKCDMVAEEFLEDSHE